MGEIQFIEVQDMAPEFLNKNFTTISVKLKKEFLVLASNEKFNVATGSIFVDENKMYFFNPPLCFMMRGSADERRKNQTVMVQ